jgi:HSP20 family protein
MRLRYRAVLYQIDDGTSLRHHYQDVIEEFVRQAQVARAIMRHSAVWRPPMDIHETADAYIIKVELAGMAEDAIDVTLYADAVVISGTRDDEQHDEEMSFHEAQIRYGPFQAMAPLPTPIDREGAEARYDNGFLYLRLPKKAPDRLRVRPGRVIEPASDQVSTEPDAPQETPHIAPDEGAAI